MKGFVISAMNYNEISAEIEMEYTWRYNEMIFLRNILSGLPKEDEKDIYRKSLITMLYSHFEGFCKFVFLYYIEKINDQKYHRKELSPFLIAASMKHEFDAYANKDKKCKIFKRKLPDDSKLHEFSRRIDFVCAFQGFLEEIAYIPDDVVNTESNLKPIVLKKILFHLGFDVLIAQEFTNIINCLLKYRNSVAHGENSIRKGVSEKDYTDIESRTFELMQRIKELVAHALRDETFLKKNIS